MKIIYRIILVIIVLSAMPSCNKSGLSGLFEREKTIEVNGKKYPEGLISFTGYCSKTVHHGRLTVSVDQNDKYEDTYETNYYSFHFDNPECPKEGDNLAKMNLKLEVDLSERYDCSYVSGDLIVKSTYDKKKSQMRIQLKNLKMSNKDKIEEYLFNGTVSVPFDYYIDAYYY